MISVKFHLRVPLKRNTNAFVNLKLQPNLIADFSVCNYNPTTFFGQIGHLQVVDFASYQHGRFARWIKWRACDEGEALLHLRHSSFSNPSFTSPTSQAHHLIRPTSRPCVSAWSSDPFVCSICRELSGSIDVAKYFIGAFDAPNVNLLNERIILATTSQYFGSHDL